MALLYHFHLLISVKESKDITHEVGNKKGKAWSKSSAFNFVSFLLLMPCRSTFKKTEQEVYFKKVLSAKKLPMILIFQI